MSFDSCKGIAEKWTADHSFKILSTDENERKIIFLHKQVDSVSFYIICPDDKPDDWNVWSDSNAVITYLQDVIDAPCSEKALLNLLDRTEKALAPLLGASAAAADSDQSSGMGSGSDMDDEEEEDDGEMDDYYNDEDQDALQDTTSTLPPEEDSAADKYFTGEGSPGAVGRLVKDMKALSKSAGQFGVVGAPRGDNLFIWDVKLTGFDSKTLLGQDINSFAKRYNREPVVYMELKFPSAYPMEPPFARVIRPRFKFLTGHITIGGSICMEMLSRSGWRPINDIESILVQIRSEVMSDPNARLETSNCDKPYDETEAKQAFERTVQRYGWNK